MKIEPLALKHQSIFLERFKCPSMPFSQFSFATLYLFRNKHAYECIFIDSHFFIKGCTHDGKFYLMLIENLNEEYLKTLFKLMREINIKMLFPLDENTIEFFKKYLKEYFYNDDDSDYLYHRNTLATYSGNRLSAKRNLVHQLFHSHTLSTQPFTPDLQQIALQVLDIWKKEHDLIIHEMADYEACKEAIFHMGDLNLIGRILYVDESPAGIIIGEQINQFTFIVHFSKTLKSIKGAYQFLLQDMMLHLSSSIDWINLEEDLGIEGLRQSKLSYSPDRLLLKWRGIFNLDLIA